MTPATSLEALRVLGWSVEPASEPVALPDAIRRRYPRLPQEVVDLVTGLQACRNVDDDAWLLTAADFADANPDGFAWNAYETMALEEADDDAARAAITAFWDAHFPLLLAVHSDYDYFAVSLAPASFGAIVHGHAPEWEQTSQVAASLAAFVDALAQAARCADPPYPVSLLLRTSQAIGEQ